MSFLRIKEELVGFEARERLLSRRTQIDKLRLRTEHLKGSDRALMQMYLDGSSYKQIAGLLGVNESNVLRRVKRIASRLLDERYKFLLGDCSGLSAFERAVGKDYFICGLSQQAISQRRLCSLYSVKKAVRAVRRFSQNEGLINSKKHEKLDLEERKYDPDYQSEQELCVG